MNENQRVLEIIQNLNYDFSQFTIPHFIDTLIQYRQRPIFLKAVSLHDELYGIWIQAPEADYIFYSSHDHPVHQVHNVLHEIGHILLDHPCFPLNEILPSTLLGQLDLQVIGQVRGQFRMCEPHRTDIEREAELFTHEMQRHIMFADRLDEPTRSTSSITPIDLYTRNLGYHG